METLAQEIERMKNENDALRRENERLHVEIERMRRNLAGRVTREQTDAEHRERMLGVLFGGRS